jgi:ABC-type multidrug transport system ATPase subunit
MLPPRHGRCSSTSRIVELSLIQSSLGGSGSGKTTLLNTIANRSGGLPIDDGQVAYYSAVPSQRTTLRGENGPGMRERLSVETSSGGRGRKLGKSEVGKRIGFVRQQDFLVECLTGALPCEA